MNKPDISVIHFFCIIILYLHYLVTVIETAVDSWDNREENGFYHGLLFDDLGENPSPPRKEMEIIVIQDEGNLEDKRLKLTASAEFINIYESQTGGNAIDLPWYYPPLNQDPLSADDIESGELSLWIEAGSLGDHIHTGTRLELSVVGIDEGVRPLPDVLWVGMTTEYVSQDGPYWNRPG